jgi:tetratricopeptide (TPR) repeat protein
LASERFYSKTSVLRKIFSQSTSLLVRFLAVLTCFCLASCSTPVGRWLDNTSARYNSYYLAKEKMKEVDLALKNSVKDDYHKILSIHYPIPDSTFGKSQSAGLEEVFKYGSWCVRFHKRSKWADNAYILIGKVRHYQYNYADGLETFKFVNSTSKSMPDRHESLVELMKLFIDFREYDNTKYVIDFLDTEQSLMTRKNKRKYLVAKASYYQLMENYQKAHEILDTVVPMCSRRNDKARLAFINGQMAEYLKGESGETKVALEFDPEKSAYKSYKTTVRANPKYELWFNAKMNLMRVSPFSDLKDQDKARAYYRKLLKDLKNKEYKDRIYYDFAAFERKLKNYEEAEKYYKLSAKNAISNQRQKAYTYLALAEMYYDEQQAFEKAQLYYDSTIAILPKDHKGYNKIFRRQRILKDFVENLVTVRREDSLQKLARMDSAELSNYLDDFKKKEEKRLNDEAKKAAKLARKNAAGASGSPFDTPFSSTTTDPNQAQAGGKPAGFNTGTQGAVFYFYNTDMMMRGKAEFQQKWGKRKLQDYWRTSAIEVEDVEGNGALPNGTDSTKAKGKDSTGVSKANGASGGEDEAKEIKIDKADLYKDLPTTPEKLQVSNDKIQVSLYKLGKIYNQHLNEPDNSIKSLQRLIDDYPDNEKVPEAHYMIYLISKGRDSAKMELHKNILLDKYPESLYAKILRNPNYLAENRILNQQIMRRYKGAYQSYLDKNYKEADSLFNQILIEYPKNDYEPKIELVQAIMKGRQGRKQEYKADLEAYLTDHPKGEYHDFAKSLLGKVEADMNRKLNEQETGLAEDSTNTAPTPNNFAPTLPSNNSLDTLPQDQGSANPADSNVPDDLPEAVKKIYEEKMRERGQGTPPAHRQEPAPSGAPEVEPVNNSKGF